MWFLQSLCPLKAMRVQIKTKTWIITELGLKDLGHVSYLFHLMSLQRPRRNGLVDSWWCVHVTKLNLWFRVDDQWRQRKQGANVWSLNTDLILNSWWRANRGIRKIKFQVWSLTGSRSCWVTCRTRAVLLSHADHSGYLMLLRWWTLMDEIFAVLFSNFIFMKHL